MAHCFLFDVLERELRRRLLEDVLGAVCGDGVVGVLVDASVARVAAGVAWALIGITCSEGCFAVPFAGGPAFDCFRTTQRWCSSC